MQTIKLTAKRQATLPAEMCHDLNLHPGDRLRLERREIDGEPAWIMRPLERDSQVAWFGALRSFAVDKTHTMDDIRRSIGSRAGAAKSS